MSKHHTIALVGALLVAACAGPNQAQVVEQQRAAAMGGEPVAQFQLGLAYDLGRGVEQDHELALQWYEKAAEAGLADAQNSAGSMLQAGLGAAQNDERALSWYRRAAEQGHQEATNNLAFMYDLGRGVDEDNREAARLYEAASDLGSAKAMMNLGVMLTKGEPGLPADPVEAYKWLDLARWATGTSGDQDLKWRCRGLLDQFGKELKPGEIAEGRRRAAEWSAAYNARH